MAQHIARRIVIWIDHQAAVLVTLAGNHPGRKWVVYSNADPRTRGGSGPQHRLEAHRQEALRRFYKAVARSLDPGDTILILGPDPCKHELRRHIEDHHGLAGKVVALLGAPRLSDAELVALGEAFFSAQSDDVRARGTA
jgi:hypothetical protein